MRSGIRSECCLTRRSTKRREKYGRDRTGRKPSFVLSFSLRAPLSYVQIDLLSLSQGTFSLAHVLCRRRVHVTCGFSPRNSLRERESREKGLRGHSLFLRSYSLFASFPLLLLCQNTLPRRESTLSPSSSTCTSRSLPPPPCHRNSVVSPYLRGRGRGIREGGRDGRSGLQTTKLLCSRISYPIWPWALI